MFFSQQFCHRNYSRMFMVRTNVTARRTILLCTSYHGSDMVAFGANALLSCWVGWSLTGYLVSKCCEPKSPFNVIFSLSSCTISSFLTTSSSMSQFAHTKRPDRNLASGVARKSAVPPTSSCARRQNQLLSHNNKN